MTKSNPDAGLAAELNAWMVRNPQWVNGDLFKRILAALTAAQDGPSAEVVERVPHRFIEAILHGDPVHREWLVDAAIRWNSGEPIPPARAMPPTAVNAALQRTLTAASKRNASLDSELAEARAEIGRVEAAMVNTKLVEALEEAEAALSGSPDAWGDAMSNAIAKTRAAIALAKTGDA